MESIKAFAKEHFRALILSGIAALIVIVLIILWLACFQAYNDLSKLYKIGFACSIGLCIAAFIIYRKSASAHPERIFLCCMLIFTCTTSWVYNTNNFGWDHDSHFDFVLQYTEPDRIHDQSESEHAMITRDMSVLDNGTFDTTSPEYESYFRSANEIVKIWDDEDGIVKLNTALDESDDSTMSPPEQSRGPLRSLFNRVSSLPASAVYAFCDLLGIPFTIKYIAARTLYAIIYSLVLYFGMRKLKSGKMLFATISMFPTAVFLATTYSYDYWVTCWTMYGAASIMGELQRPDQKMKIASMVKTLLAFLFGLAPKAIYFPFLLLCFLIPKNKFVSSKQKIIFRSCAAGCMLVLIASFIVPMLMPGSGDGDTRGGSDVSSSGQIKYILSNPIEFLQTLFSFLFGNYLTLDQSRGYTIFLAYLEFGPDWIWLTIVLLVVFLTITDTNYIPKKMITAKSRIFAVLIFFVTVCLFATSLYVAFTPVGLNTINGCQGRYLIPCLFPLLGFIGTAKLAWPKSEQALAIRNGAVIGWMTLCNYLILWQLYLSFIH